jgi:hypothetical protein
VKSKFIFIIVLFSLFLNISHDLLIADEIECECTSSLIHDIQKDKVECCEGLCDFHEVFHFSAILSTFLDVSELAFLDKKLYFLSSIFPTSIDKNTFKPPRA